MDHKPSTEPTLLEFHKMGGQIQWWLSPTEFGGVVLHSHRERNQGLIRFLSSMPKFFLRPRTGQTLVLASPSRV